MKNEFTCWLNNVLMSLTFSREDLSVTKVGKWMTREVLSCSCVRESVAGVCEVVLQRPPPITAESKHRWTAFMGRKSELWPINSHNRRNGDPSGKVAMEWHAWQLVSFAREWRLRRAAELTPVPPRALKGPPRQPPTLDSIVWEQLGVPLEYCPAVWIAYPLLLWTHHASISRLLPDLTFHFHLIPRIPSGLDLDHSGSTHTTSHNRNNSHKVIPAACHNA